MKKKLILLGLVIFGVVSVFMWYRSMATAPVYVGEFSVSQFREEIENEYFQTDKSYGTIGNVNAAAEAGKKAIADHFHNAGSTLFRWMNCTVLYDAENEAYYVRLSPADPNVLGGAFDVILRSDGTVLAIWGEG